MHAKFSGFMVAQEKMKQNKEGIKEGVLFHISVKNNC